MPDGAPIVELRGIVAGYGANIALNHIDLTVSGSEIVAVLGANGAGKSTTLRVISGAVSPREGTLLSEGEPVTSNSPRRAVLRGVAHAPEGRRIFAALSVRENIEIGAAVLAKSERAPAVEEMLDLFPRLRERERQEGGTLSGGEQQMLAIARAMASRPRLLMLDEPSLGLAPVMVAEVARLVKEVRDRGTAVLLVEQNAALGLSLADRGYVLENGTVALSGRAEELANDPQVRDAYLGSGTFTRRRTAGRAVRGDG